MLILRPRRRCTDHRSPLRPEPLAELVVVDHFLHQGRVHFDVLSGVVVASLDRDGAHKVLTCLDLLVSDSVGEALDHSHAKGKALLLREVAHAQHLVDEPSLLALVPVLDEAGAVLPHLFELVLRSQVVHQVPRLVG